MKRHSLFRHPHLISLLSILLLLAGWQLVALLAHQPELLPTLPRLLEAFLQLWGKPSFYQAMGATVGRAMAGLVLSLGLALLVAPFAARKPLLSAFLRPLLTLMRSIPVISFILLALILLNPESMPLLIAFLTMFPLLTENLMQGWQCLQPDYHRLAQLFQFPRWDRLTQVIYPQLAPYLFSGLASASGFGWRAIIMGEALGQCSWGIGSQMKQAQLFIEVPELLSWTAVAMLLSFLSDRGIGWLSHQRFPLRFHTAAKHPLPTGSLTAFSGKIDTTLNGSCSGIEAEDLNYSYAIHQFSKRFEPGRCYAISAPSGSGKTTLLALLDGTLTPTGGHLHLDRSQGVASVLQEPTLLPHLSVWENVILPLSHLYDLKTALPAVKDVLERLEIGTLADRQPATLSYGQQQRVALARALLFPSPYLLLDEPFKGLDRELIQRLIPLLRQQLQVRSLLIFTSHSQEELAQLADEVVLLNR